MRSDLAIQLDLAHVREYVIRHGWTRIGDDDAKEIWRWRAREQPLILPKQRLADYGELMAIALAHLAAVEERDEEDVAIDMSWPAYDKLHTRTLLDIATPAVPLEDGLALSDALRDLVVAAARAAEEPSRSYQGGWPRSVSRYIDLVRLIPSRQGSFELRALLPITPDSPESVLFPALVAAPIRKVTRTLLSAVAAAAEAASARVGGGSVDVFAEAVPMGVSADLLDALVRLGGSPDHPSPFEVGVSWTYAAPTQRVEPIRVPDGLLPALEQGANYLRGTVDEVAATVTGLVVRLHRDLPQGPGQVTVKGFIESPALASMTRSVKIGLDDVTYETAIDAHRSGTPVRVRCRIRPDVRMTVTHVFSLAAVATDQSV